MNYYGVFEKALRSLNLSKKDVKDWRPASEIHVPEIKGEIAGAIVIWTNDGREILFREKCTMNISGAQKRIEETVCSYYDIQTIRNVCLNRSIPLGSIIAIVPVKKAYLPWLDRDDIDGLNCIITKDGKKVFFEQGCIQPVQSAKPFRKTTVGELIKKILPSDCDLRLSKADKQCFVCIPDEIWKMEVMSDDQS
jgi:hypothetical protein